MTRGQVVEVAKKAAQKAADPKGSKPASKKQIQRLAELKMRRAAQDAPAYEKQRLRA